MQYQAPTLQPQAARVNYAQSWRTLFRVFSSHQQPSASKPRRGPLLIKTSQLNAILLFFKYVLTVSVQARGNSLKLLYVERKISELHRAEAELKSFIKEKKVPFEVGIDEILADPEWMKLQRKVESTGKVYILQDVSKQTQRKTKLHGTAVVITITLSREIFIIIQYILKKVLSLKSVFYRQFFISKDRAEDLHIQYILKKNSHLKNQYFTGNFSYQKNNCWPCFQS